MQKATDAYYKAFGKLHPQPYGYDQDRLAELVEEAVEAGRPFPDDFDFHADLPPDADA